MKLVCLVPSLTETLIWAGCNVIGRTKFCIHPKEKVKTIPVIGGTKSCDFEKILESPGLVIFDKEENRKEMAELCPYPYYACHITSLVELKKTLEELSELLKNENLRTLAIRLDSILALDSKKHLDMRDFPAVIKKSSGFGSQEKACYLIWKTPYMSVSHKTFIFSVLDRLGYSSFFEDYNDSYPSLEKLPGNNVAKLFSSEPYPFEKDWDEISQNYKEAALIDGEAFSWFGLRSILFLEKELLKNDS